MLASKESLTVPFSLIELSQCWRVSLLKHKKSIDNESEQFQMLHFKEKNRASMAF